MEIDGDNKQMVYVYSDSRDSGTDANFSITLDIKQNAQYDRVVVDQASIPKSYYFVLSGYNTLTLKEDAVSSIVTMTPANYSLTQFLTNLKTKLQNASTAALQLTIAYPTSTQPDTGKLTFTITSTNATTTQFIFSPATGINTQMGFDEGSTNTFVGGSLTSSNVINLQPIKMIYITCDCVLDTANNILQEIPNQFFNTMATVAFQTTSIEAWSKKLIKKGESIYRFALVDDSLRPIDLNGQSWSCSLLFYKKNPVFKQLGSALNFFVESLNRQEKFNQDILSRLEKLTETLLKITNKTS